MPPVLLGGKHIRAGRTKSVDTSVGVGIDTLGAGRVSCGGEWCIILSDSRIIGVVSIMQSSDVTIRTAAATSPSISLELTVWCMSEVFGTSDVCF